MVAEAEEGGRENKMRRKQSYEEPRGRCWCRMAKDGQQVAIEKDFECPQVSRRKL